MDSQFLRAAPFSFSFSFGQDIFFYSFLAANVPRRKSSRHQLNNHIFLFPSSPSCITVYSIMLLRYLIPSDARFYRLYAVPLIASRPEQFDLDGFRAYISQDNGHGAYPDSLPFTSFQDAFQTFERDTDAQYELHPKFGRYASYFLE